jgi:guanylate kinase
MSRIEYELDKQSLYDYTVVNDKLDDAIEEIERIINNEKLKQE